MKISNNIQLLENLQLLNTTMLIFLPKVLSLITYISSLYRQTERHMDRGDYYRPNQVNPRYKTNEQSF